jgi:hypothetical protein
MRLLSRLEDERKSGAIWYKISRQSPKVCHLGISPQSVKKSKLSITQNPAFVPDMALIGKAKPFRGAVLSSASHGHLVVLGWCPLILS